MFRKPEYIIMHDSLTKDGQTVSWGAIRNWHINENKWVDIGYHFGIELISDKYEILMGRIIGQVGSHCPGYNSNSIGICLVGNFDENTVPEDQWKLAVKLVAHLSKLMGIPKENILGHREAMPGRTCPHKNFDCILFREDVGEYIKKFEWTNY